MAKIIKRIAGFDGSIDLMADRIVIHRTGIFSMIKFGFNATREIPLMQISEVHCRPPILLGMGVIDFIRTGRPTQETNKSDTAVRFKKMQLQEFNAFKEKVFELMNAQIKAK
jgi:hypothetical protein